MGSLETFFIVFGIFMIIESAILAAMLEPIIILGVPIGALFVLAGVRYTKFSEGDEDE